MTEQQNTETPEVKETQAKQSSGKILKGAREALGIDLAELAEQIKVPVSVLEAIEVDRIPKNLPETFIRGYIRSYARKVNVDENRVLTEIKTTAAFEVPEMSTQEMQSFSRRTKKQAFERRLKYVSFIIISILIFAVVLWWYQDSTNTDIAPLAGGEGAETTSVPVLSAESVAKERPLSVQDKSAQLDVATKSQDEVPAIVDNEVATVSALDSAQQATEETAGENAVEGSETSTEVVDANDADNAVEESALANDQSNDPIELTESQKALLADVGEVDEEGFIKVEMLFDTECWVEVYDINDERIAVGNKPAGYLMTLNAQGPFNVLLGNPVGVTIWVNGKKFNTDSLPRNRVARFELDEVETSS